jgi:hypothetical protein
MKQLLMLLCLFVAASGVWLAVMENVLKHDGYLTRTAIAAGIAVQAIATVVYLLLHGRTLFRGFIVITAVVVLWVGASTLVNTLHAAHFEGYALVISVALILQGLLTIAVLFLRKTRFIDCSRSRT